MTETDYDRSACGIRTDGAAICWGRVFGPTPVALGGSVNWRMIADAGRCGLASDSTAFCFSSGTTTPMGGSQRWLAIAANRNDQCALSISGRVYCSTDLGVLVAGEPPLTSLGTFWTFPFAPPSAPSCGSSAAGDLYCVQRTNATTYSLTAVNLAGLKLKRFFGLCGIAVDDKAYCWGTRDTVLTPKLVPGQ